MRKISRIVYHGPSVEGDFHITIKLDGSIVVNRHINEIIKTGLINDAESAHIKTDSEGKKRTPEQIKAQIFIGAKIKKLFPKAHIFGNKAGFNAKLDLTPYIMAADDDFGKDIIGCKLIGFIG